MLIILLIADQLLTSKIKIPVEWDGENGCEVFAGYLLYCNVVQGSVETGTKCIYTRLYGENIVLRCNLLER